MTTPTHSHKAWTDKGGQVKVKGETGQIRQIKCAYFYDQQSSTTHYDFILAYSAFKERAPNVLVSIPTFLKPIGRLKSHLRAGAIEDGKTALQTTPPTENPSS